MPGYKKSKKARKSWPLMDRLRPALELELNPDIDVAQLLNK